MCKFCLRDWLPAIASHKQNFKVAKGRQLFKEGDKVNGVYFIYSGTVKVHKRWDNEKELILRFAASGDIAGQLGLGDEAVYPISATAITAAVVCFISSAFFESTLNTNSNFARQLLRVLANDLQESEKRMRNLAHMAIKGRVAQALINLKKQFGTTAEGFISLDLSRQDLASYAGAAYESLFRVLNDLVDENIIAALGKSIAITNEDTLLRLAQQTVDKI